MLPALPYFSYESGDTSGGSLPGSGLLESLPHERRDRGDTEGRRYSRRERSTLLRSAPPVWRQMFPRMLSIVTEPELYYGPLTCRLLGAKQAV